MRDGEIDGMQDFDTVIRRMIEKELITLEDGLLFSFGPRTPEALRLLVEQLDSDAALAQCTQPDVPVALLTMMSPDVTVTSVAPTPRRR